MRYARGKPQVAQSRRLLRLARSSRWLLLLLGILAISIQGLVVQAHIHVQRSSIQLGELGQSGTADPLASPEQKSGDKAPYPINEDPNCPLCQILTLASHYISSAVILIMTPAESGRAFSIEVASPVIYSTHSHFWRGRAPPSI